jgi:hypothetical protein
MPAYSLGILAFVLIVIFCAKGTARLAAFAG